ncbi:MAG TPA: HAMP domain-containing protein [bacterium]|mgnify:CR=1 FL=1|nr:HAMP domain-containing protein [bacterium]
MSQQPVKIKYKFITKLLLSHILLASLPVIITGVVLISTAHRTFKQLYQDRSVELVKHLAIEINMALENAGKLLILSSSEILNISTSRLSQELIINEIVNDFPIFRDLKLLDTTGKTLLSTSFIEDSLRHSDQPFLAQVSLGEHYQSDVFLADDKLPVIRMAEPIIQYEELVGILVAEVNLRAMWDLIEGSVIGKKAQSFIFDKTGRYIAHSERKRVYLGERFNEPEILRLAALNEDNYREYVNREGEKMAASFVSLPNLGWGVVIQQPTREAFVLFNKMRNQIILFVAAGVLISSIIAFVYTRWIVTPVNQLVSGIDRISTGDLHHRIPKLGRDEISVLADQFNEMTAKLAEFQLKLKRSERADTLNKLASVLSHEIKNPLNAMVINMQIMDRELNKNSPNLHKCQHYLRIVAAEVQRVDDLVNNFLLVARPPKLEKELTNINQTLDEIVLSQQAESLQSGVRVSRKYNEKNLQLSVDKTKMKQVFLNIFLNALQSMPGGGFLSIELELSKPRTSKSQSRWAVVRFRDTGKGIKPELLNSVFDFYFSTRQNGTGLGLSIAQQIVEEHGGTIEVESEEGKGSLFSVFLPVS